MKPWLAKTVDGRYPIEHIPCPFIGSAVDLSKPRVGVLHTTEGGWAGSLSVFKQHYAPHFLVDVKRIAQLGPLGSLASALENAPNGVETNRWAVCQIEVVGHSQEQPYSFPQGTTDALASLMATLKGACGIPLSRPYPDAMPPQPWATESFARRHDGKWGKTAGWFGHVEVPENSHWDPGALQWSLLLALAKTRVPSYLRPYYAVRVVAGRLVRA